MAYNMSYIHEYRDNGLSVIPVNGKISVVKGWQEFCNRWPAEEEIDSWENVRTMSGIGLVMGKASNLCCVDIDEDDCPDRLKRLLDELPYSPVRKVGKKGETRFFRLYDDITEYIPYHQQKIAINNPLKKRALDIYLEVGYSVIPPSMHPGGGQYVWTGDALTPDYDISELPVLNIHECVTIATAICKGKSVEANLPVDHSAGRFNQMTSYASKLSKSRVPIESAIESLLTFDKENFAHKLYFLDKEKGHKTISARINAGKYYMDHLANYASKHLSIDDIEEPQKMIGGQPIAVLSEGWETPIPLNNVTFKDFNQELIPNNWKTWILDNAEITGVAPQNILLSALVSLSACFGNKVMIKPKKYDGWVEPPVMWGIVVDQSGNKKSQVKNIALKAVKEINRNIIEKSRSDAAKADSTNKIIDMKLKNLNRNLKMAIDSNESVAYLAKLEQEINLLDNSKENIANKKLIVNTSTPEALMQTFNANPEGIFVVEDEFGALIDRLAKKGYENLRGLLLGSWDGVGDFTYSTVSRGDLYIEKVCAAFLAYCQPSVFRESIRNATNGRDDGLIQRSLIVFSESKPRKTIDRPVNLSEEHKALTLFHKAKSLDEKKQAIPFAPAAQVRMMAYLDQIDIMVNTANSDTVGSFFGKFRGNAAKLAFLYEFIDSSESGYPKEISLKNFEKAIMFLEQMRLYVDHAFLTEGSSPVAMAMKLLTRIKTKEIKTGSTYKDIIRFCKDITKNRDKLGQAMKVLVDHNYLKVDAVGTEFEITINPHI